MPGYYGVKLGRHWNRLKNEIWDLQDLHSNTVYLLLKGEIIFVPKIIKTYRGSCLTPARQSGFHLSLDSPAFDLENIADDGSGWEHPFCH